MLNHLTWQKFRKSLISMASRDARKGGGTLTFIAERFFFKLSVMNIICLSPGFSSTLPGNYLSQKGTMANKKVSFPIQFLVCICSPKGTGLCEHSVECWGREHSPLGHFPRNPEARTSRPLARPGYWPSLPRALSVSLEREPVFGRCGC